MPPKQQGTIIKLCKEIGCQFTALPGKVYCSMHDKPAAAATDAPFKLKFPSQVDPFYTSTPWRRLRESYLSRHPICESGSCTQAAQEVHHKLRKEQHPALALSEANLKALCRRCHLAESAGYQGPGKAQPEQGSERVSVPTTFVYGPPAAGKSSLVARLRKPRELVIDVDALLSAITGPGESAEQRQAVHFALAARDAMLKRLFRASAIPRVWVLSTRMPPAERRYWARAGASVWLLLPPKAVCLERALEDIDRPAADWAAIINRWYADYTRVESDQLLNDY